MQERERRYIIYCYFFKDRAAYVGQTCRETNRRHEHKCLGPISNRLKSSEPFDYLILEDRIESNAEASERECFWYKEIKRQGWTLLNGVDPSESNYDRNPRMIWTYERLKTEALKFKSIRQWKRRSRKSYGSAYSKGLVRELSAHMPPLPPKLNKLFQLRITKSMSEWIKALHRKDRHRINVKVRAILRRYTS